jgi:Zn-finger nucleic acid-binding protein
MKCPACGNELSQTVAAGVTLEVCIGGCGGLWFDAFELQRVAKAPPEEIALSIMASPMARIDPAKKRACPKCDGIVLMRHFFSPKRRVEVDECPNCGGYWLDAGELAAIQGERDSVEGEKKAAKEFITRLAVSYIVQHQSGIA